MPSLRRTHSSPSVRSSPYASPLSSVTSSGINTRIPRRSSGSATANRRVLADIDWWRVTDGQCDADQPEMNVTTPVSEERQWTPWAFDGFFIGAATNIVPIDELATLSILPRTPTRRLRGRESSSSSNSTSETPPDGVADLGLGLAGVPPSLLATPTRAPLHSLRAYSFSDFSYTENTLPVPLLF